MSLILVGCKRLGFISVSLGSRCSLVDVGASGTFKVLRAGRGGLFEVGSTYFYLQSGPTPICLKLYQSFHRSLSFPDLKKFCIFSSYRHSLSERRRIISRLKLTQREINSLLKLSKNAFEPLNKDS